MSMIHVSCPHCSFSREVPADKLPDQTVKATCPNCHQTFDFNKESARTQPPPVPSPSPAASAAQQEPVFPPPLPKPEPADRPGSSGAPESRGLMSVNELLATTWELFKKRWLLLIGIFITTGVACVVPPMLVAVSMGASAKGSFTGTVAMLMLLGLAIIGSFLLICWGMAAAVTAAVDETVGFRDAFERAKACWISLAWVSSLYSFIVGGASLLFVIPGILTGIWFFACAYLVVAENTRGMDALLKSKALVDGRFPAVAGRLALVWLLGMVLGMIPVIGALFSLVMAPFSMLYSVVLYRNLSETAGTVSWSGTDGTKAGWLLLGLAGYLLVPLVLFILLGAAFFSSMEPLFKMLLQNANTGQQITILDPSLLKRLLFP